MKNYIFVILAFLLLSCSLTQSSESKLTKETLKGSWEIINVKSVGNNGVAVDDLFDIANSSCFKGSEWVFVPSNGSGKFTILNSSQCETSNNKIQWSLHEPGDGTFQFLFKYVDSTKKGYGSKIDQLNAKSMIMQVSSTFEGKPVSIVMTFNKISEEIN